MGFFEQRRQRREAARVLAALRAVDGRQIRYVTRREPDAAGNPTETVLGKGGRIWMRADEARITAADREIFACPAGELELGELLSGDGMVFKGRNRLTGQVETVVAYYLYFR
ncbi:MAG: hypothetical protein ACOYJY_04990 [Acutalibacteraceae bacterium]|jgi:hypothetical protein